MLRETFRYKICYRRCFQKLASITGLRVFPMIFPSLPTAGQFDVEMVVQTPDEYDDMESYAKQMVAAAYQSDKFMFVDTDLKISLPQVKLAFDHTRIAGPRYGYQQC